METTLRPPAQDINDDLLRTLGTQIYNLLGETSLVIKCTVKHDRLVVLGEHNATLTLSSDALFDRLGQNLQSLQLCFTQQVRLYFRRAGQRQPYAYRQFVLAPPPPLLGKLACAAPITSQQPSLSVSQPFERTDDEVVPVLSQAQSIPTVSSSAIDEQPWIVGDAELDALVNQLTALDPLENWDLASSNDANLPPEQEQSITPTEEQSHSQILPIALPQSTMEHLDQDAIATSYSAQTGDIAWTPSSSIPETLIQTPDIPEDKNVDHIVSDQLASGHTVSDQPMLANGLLEDGLIPNASELFVSSTDVPSTDVSSTESTAGSENTFIAPSPNPQRQESPSLSLRSASLSSQAIALTTEAPGSLHASSTPDSALDHEHQSSLVFTESEPSDALDEPGFHTFTYETSQRLKELSHSLLHPKSKSSIEPSDSLHLPATAQLENSGYRRVAIATIGLASVGFVAGLYGATRPCVLGGCVALQEADQVGAKSQRMMQQAQKWTDVEAVLLPLTQALEILEPIPMWSPHSSKVQGKRETYAIHLGQIDQLLDVEQAIKHANQLESQAVYTFDDLQTAHSLWKSAIDDLASMPIDSPLHTFAQIHLEDYHPQLSQVEQKLQREDAAMTALETAQEAAQLAQVRQGVAQSLENWQFAKVTWLVAFNRLKQVGDGTLAAREAERLLAFYQTSLDEVNAQVSREQVAAASLEKAIQHAQLATAAEQRHDWTKAIADWNRAVRYTQEIESRSTYYLKAEGLLTQYQGSIQKVDAKLKAKTLIEGELKQSCIGELQLCHIVSIDQSIKLQLDESYMDAIATARRNENYNLKAVVTDHQLMLRQNLDRVANSFELPIEVYNPDGGLLERHMPKLN